MANNVKIRVLIVDDIPETRENIRRLLQFEGDMEVVGAARTGREAIDLVQETKPDVAIMDINMPDMDGIQATEIIRKKYPVTQVIILSVQGDNTYLRKAMLAGARDFLTKPPMIDELTTAIRRAAVMAQEERSKAAAGASQTGPASTTGREEVAYIGGKIVVIYSPKGGTGATTIATNLAVYLQTPETRVALVDGNLQFGDVAVFLNQQGKNTVLDLAPRVDELDPDIVEDVMVTHSASGIRILAAPSRPEMAEKVTGEQFAKVLNYLRTLYHYVIVDTSSILTEVVLSSIDVADLIVLITTQDIPAIKSANAFLSLADGIQISRQRILFTMSRYDKRIAIAPEKVGESLKQTMGAVIPFDEKIVVSSVNHGIPFMLDAGKTQPIGKSIAQLGDTIREKMEKTESNELERVGKRY
jgi:pilus assembly protein CpaE